VGENRDSTSIGGLETWFPPTDWNAILEGASVGPHLAQIAKRYWKPCYCYLRRKGYDNETAKDLVQGFFLDVVTRRGLVAKADPARGRFRTFLLTALSHYVTDVLHRRDKRLGPPAVQLGLEELPQTVPQDPAGAFAYSWAAELIDQVLRELETACRRDGLPLHWEIFRDRLLRPMLDNTPPPGLAELCARYGVRDERLASNMIITVKRRFQALLREHLQAGEGSEAAFRAELGQLIEILASPRAGPQGT
jgi:DNA-directed RNA polymerase specialized sigma24 family protein